MCSSPNQFRMVDDLEESDVTRPRRSSGWIISIASMLGVMLVPATLVTLFGTSPSLAQDRPTTRTNLCTIGPCHDAIVERKVMHQPAVREQCMDCHEYADEAQHLFRLTKPKRELCSDCHELQLAPVVHTPVANGDCLGCHDPHGSDHRALLIRDLSGALCAECHEEDYTEMEFVHGPVVVGACGLCHDAHASDQPNLLIQSPTGMCVGCHDTVVPKGAAASRRHQPMDRGCTSCHDPHASNLRGQLREPVPEMCFDCHGEIEKLLTESARVHEPAARDGGCVTCHDPHYAMLPKLQKRPQPDICLNCHDREIEMVDGPPLPDMARLLEENPNHHGPIREGGCTECHQPHAADHFRLLFLDYPPDFYAPFDRGRYALCFSCHQIDLVLEESGTGLTGFRDGDRNLHWVHVNREKGRTCRACHEVHASQHPFHIRESVPFGAGGWLLEINFEKSEDGGSCLPACHKRRTYVRGAPAALPEETAQ
jgi:predicted CXXCH cytochrome family protein